MFRGIPSPDPPRLTCQDAATPDLSAYYQTAMRLFASAFSAKERTAEDDVQFLQQIIASIQSPSQIVPALKMMPEAGARMTASQRQQLAGAIAGVLDRVAGSDREYAASENVLVPSALSEMHDSQMFVPALRSYIVRHLSAARCSDAIPAGGLPESARQFNALIARLSPTTAQLRPIALEEAQPLRVEGAFEKRPVPAGLPAGAGLHFLEQQYAASDNHEIWFSQVQAMLKTASSAGELGEMARSSNPIIRSTPGWRPSPAAPDHSRPAYSSSMWSLKFSMARVRRTFMVAVSSPCSIEKSRASTRYFRTCSKGASWRFTRATAL